MTSQKVQNRARLSCDATDFPRGIFLPAGILCVDSDRRTCGATDILREIFHAVGTVNVLYQTMPKPGCQRSGAVGMVSALNHHRACENVHIWGYTVGTLRWFSYHHAYKILGESRHDASFRA